MTARRRTGASSLAICAVFTALLAICAQIQIPIPGVPLNLALFSVFLCALLLGPARAALSVGAYLLLGLFGIPVFSGFASGPAAFLRPSGGFLAGYLLCAVITGLLARRSGAGFSRMLLSSLAGAAACMLLGAGWFLYITHTEPCTAAFAFFLIYLPGDFIKAALAALLARRLLPPLRAMGL